MFHPRVTIAALLAGVLAASSVTAGGTTAKEHQLSGPVHRVVTRSPSQITTDLYNRSGNLTEVRIDDIHEPSSIRYVFTYDPQGRLKEEIGLDGAGNQLYRNVYAYATDERAGTTAQVAASAAGEFRHAEFWSYDERGQLLETLRIEESHASRNLYDVLGQLLYSGRYREGRLFAEVLHRYDSTRRPIEMISYDSQGAMTGRHVNAYDEQGRRLESTIEKFGQAGSNVWVITYDHDREGNWIKEWLTEPSSTSTPSPPRLVQERVIEYYQNP